MTVCQDCGSRHVTGLGGFTCDLRTKGEEETRRFHHDVLGLTHRQIDDLVQEDPKDPDDA